MEKGLVLLRNNWSFNKLDSLFLGGRDLLHLQKFLCKRFTRVSLSVNTNLAKVFFFKYSHNGEKYEYLSKIRIKVHPLDRMKCTMPYAPQINQNSSSGSYEVYDAVCSSTTTETDTKEDEDAGNTN